MTTKLTAEDAAATRKSALLGVLIDHCGEQLTPNKIDLILVKLLETVESASMAWAFKFVELNAIRDLVSGIEEMKDAIEGLKEDLLGMDN